MRKIGTYSMIIIFAILLLSVAFFGGEMLPSVL